MRRRYVVPGLVLTVVVVVCILAIISSGMRVEPIQSNMSVMAMPTPAPTMAAQVAALGDTRYASGEMDGIDPEIPVDPVERVVLRNAVLTLVVDDVDAKVAEITALAGEFGGWVVNAQVSRAPYGDEIRVSSGTITIRVDANRLDQALALIKDGVHEVRSESVTGQDVTQDYVDLSSQVANLEAAEKQLQEIMSRAEKTEDVLNVYNQLVNVRGQIETMRGRLRYYDEAATYSSIQVTLSPTPIIQPVEIAGWRPLETARNAFQALLDLLRGAADVAITVVVFGLPLVVVAVIPVWFIRRRRVTRMAG